jgi:uncharacterized membrane protein
MVIGHFYIEEIRSGIIIMVTGFILIILFLLSFLTLSQFGFGIFVLLIIVWLTFLVRQIYGVNKLVKESDRILREAGRVTW